MTELRCFSCHADPGAPLEQPPAPDLTAVGARVAPEYLQQFLADPLAVQPGTKMPDVLRGRSRAERAEIAVALTHFLVSRSEGPFVRGAVNDGEAAMGRRLFHSIGCVACHPPFDAPQGSDEPPRKRESSWPEDDLVRLDHVVRKYAPLPLADFLMQPLHVRPGGRMPDMGLAAREARAIASYLLEDAEREAAEFAPSAELVELGSEYFSAFRCAACHENVGTDFVSDAPPRADLEPNKGCLNAESAGSPGFDLSAERLVDIATALASPLREWTDEMHLDATLVAMRCDACHLRGQHGGVSRELDPYFRTSQPDLGDEARIPPPLTDAGTKLQEDWIGNVLFDGASVRSYMYTRMPQFGLDNLGQLPARFARIDAPIPYTPHEFKGDEERRAARDAGRRLLGIRGGACVSCHDWNGKPSSNFRGLDLIGSTERLHPGWFRELLIAPQKLRPGIVMPESWSDGEAAHPDLEGDTDAQIQAIWDYLALGRSADDPDGITRQRSELFVTDEVRTYRGRSRIAGFRGIAVGYPGGLNYAFDANNGSLAGLWTGNFVTVHWESQGAGDFNPADRPVELARDLAFYPLANEREPWPLRPLTTDEEPINPDPAYPRNRGYRFRGYTLGENLVPTLLYDLGDVAIEDTSAADLAGEHPVLRRTLRLHAPVAQTLWFRVLTGRLEEVGPNAYQSGRLRVTLPDGRVVRRSIGTDEEPADELLVELLLPAGELEVKVAYELR